MGAVYRRRPPGAMGDVGEVSLQFWRAGGVVELEFTGTPVAIKVTQVWGATTADTANQPRWAGNSVRFRLGDSPSLGVDGKSAFSFAASELPETTELQITCTDPKSPLPPPPPLPPPWPPAPPPQPCVLGAHVSLNELETDPFRRCPPRIACTRTPANSRALGCSLTHPPRLCAATGRVPTCSWWLLTRGWTTPRP